MQIPIAIATAQRFHSGHPEMVGIGTEDMNGLPKAQLNFESIPVELKGLQRSEGEIGA